VNLSARDYGVLQVGDGDDVIIVEGQTRLVTDGSERRAVAERYGEKYVEPVTGERAAIDWPGAALYRLDANKVMAWIYGNVAARTDWRLGFLSGRLGQPTNAAQTAS
jgi:hypothetical protein